MSSGNLKITEAIKTPLIRSPNLMLISNTPKGRGIFASSDIPAQFIIEVSPVLVMDPKENEHIRNTELYNYTYNWPYHKNQHQNNRNKITVLQTQAIILGLGSMFNHSSMRQNVGWERDVENKIIKYTTLREIKAGEELCICYGQKLSFEDVDVDQRTEIDEDWLNGLSEEIIKID